MAGGGFGGREGEDFDARESNREAGGATGGEEAEQDVVGSSGLVGWVGECGKGRREVEEYELGKRWIVSADYGERNVAPSFTAVRGETEPS